MNALRSIRRRFELVPGQHKAHPLRNGIIFLALVTFVLYIGYSKDVPFLNEGGQEITATFTSAVNVIPQSDVRVNGVTVGSVEKVDLAENGRHAEITMKIRDDSGVVVKRDARAGVWWRTLLGGNFYVELDPGSRSAEPIGDAKIPVERTTTQVEFDELLTTFDADTRESMQGFIREFDDGFSNEAAPRDALDRTAPAMSEAAEALPALRGQRPGTDIPNLAREASRTFGALARDEGKLAGLIENGTTAIGVAAARRQDIGSMLAQAPTTLDDTRTTMARLRTTLDELDPVADELRPGLRRVDETVAAARPAMRELSAFVPDALPFLRDIDPAMRDLRTASKTAVPLMARLTPTLERVRDEINPFLDRRHETTGLKNSWAIGPFFGHIASSAGPFDTNGHVQNFQTLPNSLGQQIAAFDCDRYGSAAANCEAITATLGTILGAGPGALK